MASEQTNIGSAPSIHNFHLTKEQEELLMAALTASAPLGTVATTHANSNDGFDENAFLGDFGYEFGHDDGGFGLGAAIGDNTMPATDGVDGDSRWTGDKSETSPVSVSDKAETHEKRARPDEEDGDEATGNNRAKRQEGVVKVAKKPGRKPIIDEPTTKRKAQNRAAQRAFRERKEKHLSDLETKVAELQKESEDSQQEKEALRKQLESVVAELDRYKQRVAVLSGPAARMLAKDRMPSQGGFGSAAVHNLGDVHFQFDFSGFSNSPGSSGSLVKSPSPMSPQQSTPTSQKQQWPPHSTPQTKMMMSAASPATSSAPHKVGSRGSIGSLPGMSGGAAASSPSVSSHNSIRGMSSCETSPEPYTQSPLAFKSVDTMTTIGEEQAPACAVGGTSAPDKIETFDNSSWLVGTNAGHFDPQLYNYRDPLDQGLGTGLFDAISGNDYDIDFPTAYFQPPPMHLAKGPDLISMIDRQQQLDADSGSFLPPAIVPAAASSTTAFSTTQIWQKLVNCEKVRSGDVDMDALCSDLAKKATCRGYGPEVAQHDFQHIVDKHVSGSKGVDSSEKSPSMTKCGPEGERRSAGVNLSSTG